MYPAFIATAISMFELSRLTLVNHNKEQPRTLSALAVTEPKVLSRFRNILLLCGILFAITMFGFYAPFSNYVLPAIFFSGLMIGGEVTTAIVPASGKTVRLHRISAKVMALGMFGLAYLFYFDTTGTYAQVELYIALIMTLLVPLTFLDKKRFVFYELAFIFLSHVSILIAVLAVSNEG